LEKNVEIGKVYKGEVTKVLSFGAFVMILPEVEGLLHISQIAPVRIGSVNDILKEGSAVNVKCVELNGDKIRLTMKELEQQDPEVAQNLEKVIASGGVPAKPRQDRNRGGYKNDKNDRNFRGGYRGKNDRDSNSRSRGNYQGSRDSNNGDRSSGSYRGENDRNANNGDNRDSRSRNKRTNSTGRRFNRS